ncbi:MAG: YihY/virulence factor BrkB family protein [Nocardioidaceae bacterium]
MALTDRLDRFQQRRPWAGFPIAVAYKYADDQGNYLAALMTYYGFLSLFPLLLLLSSVLGFALQGDPGLQQRILDSALGQFPVIGDQLSRPGGLQGSGLAILGTTIMSALGGSAGAFGVELGIGIKLVITLLSVALNAAVFVLAFRVATAERLSLRDSAPGAVTAAVCWQLLQLLGTAYVGHVVKNASATNGVFALVLGLIAWIFLGAVSVVFCVEINVVRTHRLYPRALLTPFTEKVDLTSADQRAYSGYATAQRSKESESVEVSFEDCGRRDESDDPP